MPKKTNEMLQDELSAVTVQLKQVCYEVLTAGVCSVTQKQKAAGLREKIERLGAKLKKRNLPIGRSAADIVADTFAEAKDTTQSTTPKAPSLDDESLEIINHWTGEKSREGEPFDWDGHRAERFDADSSVAGTGDHMTGGGRMPVSNRVAAAAAR